MLRWLKNGVLVHDASYYIAVQLEGPEAGILSLSLSLCLSSLFSFTFMSCIELYLFSWLLQLCRIQ